MKNVRKASFLRIFSDFNINFDRSELVMKKEETERKKELRLFYRVVIFLMVFVSVCSYKFAYKYRTAKNETNFYEQMGEGT